MAAFDVFMVSAGQDWPERSPHGDGANQRQPEDRGQDKSRTHRQVHRSSTHRQGWSHFALDVNLGTS